MFFKMQITIRIEQQSDRSCHWDYTVSSHKIKIQKLRLGENYANVRQPLLQFCGNNLVDSVKMVTRDVSPTTDCFHGGTQLSCLTRKPICGDDYCILINA